ncbi:MAG: calcium-translocating P-type ATPase, PMCA-type [Firmicutes bacterium]|nr:calcium-translocating P-type ATPase, PMCA-type [Bacillota bacterium]
MEAYKISAQSVVNELGSDTKRGLSNSQVNDSIKKYGKNVLKQKKPKSLFFRIYKAATEPMMIILLIALGITLAVQIINMTRGEGFEFVEVIGIFVAIVLSCGITIFMEGRQAKSFAALKKMTDNVLVQVIRAGIAKKIPMNEVVVGDIIKIESGDKIVVDARLIRSVSLTVNESSLTGESLPIKKDAEFIGDDNLPLAERKNMVYSGTFVFEGMADAIVTSVGDSTQIGQIASALGEVEKELTPLQQKLDKLGKVVAIGGAIAAAVVFFVQFIRLLSVGGLSFDSVQEIFITSIVLIVASVPEGLPTIVAISLALNVIKMAKHKALVKKMVACETIGAISVICSDKTGTLTKNEMTASHFYTPKGMVEASLLSCEFVKRNIAINSTANLGGMEQGIENKFSSPKFIGNVTECALLVSHEGVSNISYSSIRENSKILFVYPFSSDTKRMSTIVQEKDGSNTLYSKGAPEIILGLCEISGHQKQKLLSAIEYYQSRAKRVIAFAHGKVQKCDFEKNRTSLEKGLIFDGFAVISDPIRDDVYDAVSKCRNAGVKVKILTGDNVLTARAIAYELGIITTDDEVYHASAIENMSDAALEKNLHKIKVVARSTPLTKLRVVKALKRIGETVAVTGDGINDAPALKSADVGIAMGITGTEVSKEASDIVLLDDSFSTIVTSVKWGRGIHENFQRFMMFQLTVNLSAVLVTVLFILIGRSAPFNALQLLWLNLIMDGPPALTLGLEPIKDNLLKRKPQNRNNSIITKTMLTRIILNGLFITFLIMLQALTGFMGIDSERERTFLFTAFVVLQLMNALNARELGETSILKYFSKNKILLLVLTFTLALQVIITQFGAPVFGTTPLHFADWVKVILVGLSIIVFNESYKFIWRLKLSKRLTKQRL